MFPFDPPENIRKPKVFWCFQEDQKETLREKRISTWDWIQKKTRNIQDTKESIPNFASFISSEFRRVN